MSPNTATEPGNGKAAKNDAAQHSPTFDTVLKDAVARWAEVKEYLGYFLATKVDALRLSIRQAIFYAALGVIGLLAAVAGVVTAVVLLLIGAAHLISVLLGGRQWAGELIVGATVIGSIALATFIVLSKLTRTSRTQTVKKYESRKRQQRLRFGHDVSDRAATS